MLRKEGRACRNGFGGRLGAAWLFLGMALLLPMGAEGGCYTAHSQPLQGLCTDKYEVKVCAANQDAADLYVLQTHGVIVKANCKKALTILCGGVGGGEPSDDWADVCCRVANQCETDADCGEVQDPASVPMCCDYCMSMYSEACESDEPRNAGFMSVGTLYHAFYGSDVWRMCHNKASSSGTSECAEIGANNTRVPGTPCLGVPLEDASESADAATGSASRNGAASMASLLMLAAVSLLMTAVQQ
mmetsp:Transcript_11998/g.23704  ORF Transcript_11998/g.23704 Transcript_11998/m.23704 type:complete len:245 (-) Transcript_11998:233-967(-)